MILIVYIFVKILLIICNLLGKPFIYKCMHILSNRLDFIHLIILDIKNFYICLKFFWTNIVRSFYEML